MRTMKKKMGILSIGTLMVFVLLPALNCSNAAEETPITEIPMAGPIKDIAAELSGLAWYKDYLVILPQYPNRFKSEFQGKIPVIPRSQILAFLDQSKNSSSDSTMTITPQEIEFEAPGLDEKIKSFEGFEALAFYEDNVFMTIESSPGPMLGYLVKGKINPDMSRITLDTEKLVKIQPQACLENSTYETILVTDQRVMVIYEGNGSRVNVTPMALIYDHDLNFVMAVAFPNIEYRITDATAMDKENRFWCINYFWPGGKDRYFPGEDSLAALYGRGKTNANADLVVERLVEFQYIDAERIGSPGSENIKYPSIIRIDAPPIQLELVDYNNDSLLDSRDARNWEGIVRRDDRGFLLVTDQFPRTILACVPK